MDSLGGLALATRGYLDRALRVMTFIVDLWSIALRRKYNEGKILDYKYCDLGEPKNMLSGIMETLKTHRGEGSFEYAHCALTLALFFGMYDKEHLAFPCAKKARAGFLKFLEDPRSKAKPEYKIAEQMSRETEDVYQALKFFVTKRAIG